jgi:protoporphyrinogen oxidase
LAGRELVSLGLAEQAEVEDGVVFRQPKAYPVYDLGYQDRLRRIASYLAEIENLQTIGRNGRHYYGNQDHSMLTGLRAVRNLLDKG